jgi:hypothetical protein
VSQANVPGNIPFDCTFRSRRRNKIFHVLFFSSHPTSLISRWLARSIVSCWISGNGDVADYRPDAPTHEESPFLFFPCLLYRVSFDQLHKFAV